MEVGLKRYWKRRGYGRLNGSGRQRMKRAELGRAGSGTGRRKRFWRIKITRKLRFLSPKKFLFNLRDAYVNFMLRIANSGGFGVGAVDYSFGGGGFRRSPVKEYDEKMIVEIYKSLVMAQEQMVPHDPARSIATQIGYLR